MNPHLLHVVCLRLESLDWTSLVPFYGFSPAVRSHHLTHSATEVSDRICSFPLLENLVLDNLCPESDTDGWGTPPTSPKLTGALDLWMHGAHPVTRLLLNFQCGLHFSSINTTISDDGAESVTDMVSRCSGTTLEFLDILYRPSCAPPSAPVTDRYPTAVRRRDIPGTASVDLSKVTKLKYLGFCGKGQLSGLSQHSERSNSGTLRISPSTKWCPPRNDWGGGSSGIEGTWTDCWSDSPRTEYLAGREGNDLRDRVPSLLLELTGRGLVDG